MRPLFIIPIVLAIALMLSGCTSPIVPGPRTYVTHPTHVQYTLRYGYDVNATGMGAYTIKYTCDLPEVTMGYDIPYTLLNTTSYTLDERADNSVVVWNITGATPNHYILGVQTKVTAETYLYPDLSGESADSLAQLRVSAEDYITRYTNVQGNETIRFIDPANPAIKAVADSVLRNSSTNSLLLAKALFRWLKENIHYQLHESNGVQPAATTLVLKTGDCDDLSFLYISLCRAVGIPARFIRGYLVSEGTPMQAVAHAWAEVFIGPGQGVGGWIPVECACVADNVQTDIEQNFGVEDCFHLRVFQDIGTNESLGAALASIYVVHDSGQHIEISSSFATVSNYLVITSKELVVQTDGTRLLQ